MFRLEIVTEIAAPPERCFDLARDVEVHCLTAAFTGERVVAPGRTSGLLEAGEVVTFEAVHLGVRQRLTARIVECDRPHRFVDEQVRGAFRTLRHVHEFAPVGDGTRMRDLIQVSAPFGPVGLLAERLFLRRYLETFVRRKQLNLKRLAETGS